MLVRRARALVLTFAGPALGARNFIARSELECSWLSLRLLALATDWATADQLLAWFPYPERYYAHEELLRLASGGCLVVAGTALAERDDSYADGWAWGVDAGLYHFGMKDPVYLEATVVNANIAQKLEVEPDVPLFTTNNGTGTVRSLPPPDCSNGVRKVMRARRSEREFAPDPISLAQLGDCLFAGLGITGFLDIPIPGHPPLPLKMAPSGGARNPYEAYVYAVNVAGLPAGLYHYSALEHSLAPVASGPIPPPGVMLTGQHWADDAAAVVFLVANFNRMAWKYGHPTGYRVVLVEAGHIAQNVLLAATEHGLSGVPTTAVADSLIESSLGIDGSSSDVVYALALGPRVPADVDPPPDVRGLVREVV
jgi:SagB-type dehydrogenase family enzyme